MNSVSCWPNFNFLLSEYRILLVVYCIQFTSSSRYRQETDWSIIVGNLCLFDQHIGSNKCGTICFGGNKHRSKHFLHSGNLCKHWQISAKKIMYFHQYTGNFWSIRQATLIIFIFAERKVVNFVDFCLYSNNFQSKYWTYTYFPKTFCHF